MTVEKTKLNRINKKKVIGIIIVFILYTIIFFSIYYYLTSTGLEIQIFLIILIYSFLLLLVIGPFFKGSFKTGLYDKYVRASERDSLDEIKSEEGYKLDEKQLTRVSLNVKYIKPLITKCPKCKFLLTKSMKKCPNCGFKIEKI